MSEPRKLTFGERLQYSQLPRRILGVVLGVPVPGAGHVVLGYPRIGWIVASIWLALFTTAVVGAILVITKLFLAAGAALILVMVVSSVSIFALPPGPRLKDGLRALWPVLLLFVLMRGVVYITGAYALQFAPTPDESMAPALHTQDTIFVRPGDHYAVGDVVFLEPSAGTFQFRRVVSLGDMVQLSADADSSTSAVERSRIRGKALFIFAAGKTDGRGRIWRALSR